MLQYITRPRAVPIEENKVLKALIDTRDQNGKNFFEKLPVIQLVNLLTAKWGSPGSREKCVDKETQAVFGALNQKTFNLVVEDFNDFQNYRGKSFVETIIREDDKKTISQQEKTIDEFINLLIEKSSSFGGQYCHSLIQSLEKDTLQSLMEAIKVDPRAGELREIVKEALSPSTANLDCVAVDDATSSRTLQLA